MQTSQVGESKGAFFEIIGPALIREAIGVAYGHIFNNGELIQDKSCGSGSREFPGAASSNLSVDRPACDLLLPDPSALRVLVTVCPKPSRAANSVISGTSGFHISKRKENT
jgi:hypothetical protein